MSTWFRETRLKWMRESIEIFGFLNRGHIQSKFGIGPAQAAKGLSVAQARWPKEFTYNASAKRYERPNG